MSQLAAVFAAVEQAQQQEAEAEQQQQANIRRLEEMRKEAINKWLGIILDNAGIRVPVVDQQAVVEGFTFTLKMNWRGSYPQYYPLVLKPGLGRGFQQFAPENASPTNHMSCHLIITSTLAEQYRKNQPRGFKTYAEWRDEIGIDKEVDGDNWTDVSVKIGRAVQFLTKEMAEAPVRKAQIDAEWEQEQERHRKEDAEREEGWRLQQEQEEVERQERRREWEREQQERQQREAERQERENQLRAEVAAKFGVSVEAFEYLIDMLATEIERRNQCEQYEY